MASPALLEQLRQDLVDVVALADATSSALDCIPRDLRKASALAGLALATAQAALARADAAAAADQTATCAAGDQH